MVSGLCLFLMIFRAAGLAGTIMEDFGFGSSLTMLLQFMFVVIAFILIGSGIYEAGQKFLGKKDE